MPKATLPEEALTIDVVIEIPQGSRNKFEWDETRRVIRLDRRIPGAVSYPAHYGFVPGTLASDGDPVDVLVIAEPPLYPGVWMTARAIGVAWISDDGVLEPKVVCVPESDPGSARICRLGDLPPLMLQEIEQFFDVYKILEPGKHTRFARWGGRKEAAAAVRNARTAALEASKPSQPVRDPNDREVEQLVARLRELDKTVAVAESCTGGLVASSIAATEGAGECLRGAIVAYAEQVKYDVLGVTPGAGVINAPAARQMAPKALGACWEPTSASLRRVSSGRIPRKTSRSERSGSEFPPTRSRRPRTASTSTVTQTVSGTAPSTRRSRSRRLTSRNAGWRDDRPDSRYCVSLGVAGHG